MNGGVGFGRSSLTTHFYYCQVGTRGAIARSLAQARRSSHGRRPHRSPRAVTAPSASGSRGGGGAGAGTTDLVVELVCNSRVKQGCDRPRVDEAAVKHNLTRHSQQCMLDSNLESGLGYMYSVVIKTSDGRTARRPRGRRALGAAAPRRRPASGGAG